MVKGVTRELFYGTGETAGLVQCLTVFGDGKININTAPKPVLRALSAEMTDEAVDWLDEYRRDERNDLADPGWYQQRPRDDRTEHPRRADLGPERYLPDHGRRPPGKDDGADHRHRQAGNGSEEGQTPVLES